MGEKTYIRRSKHDKQNPYFMLRQDTAQNKGLSYEALGLLTYLLSKPDDWHVQINDLQRGKAHGLEKHTTGRDKARVLLDELCEKGYARREKQSRNPETGLFEYGDYEVAELPIFLEPCTEKPLTVEPYTVTPLTVNPTLHSIELDKVENTDIAALPIIVTKSVPEYLMPVFVAVVNHIFKLHNLATLTDADVKRYRAMAQVARTKAGGKDIDANEVARLIECYAKYCTDNGYTPPQSQLKFSSGFDAYVQNYKPIVTIAPLEEVDIERARLESMNRFSHMRQDVP